jgi:hypothetical protein
MSTGAAGPDGVEDYQAILDVDDGGDIPGLGEYDGDPAASGPADGVADAERASAVGDAVPEKGAEEKQRIAALP